MSSQIALVLNVPSVQVTLVTFREFGVHVISCFDSANTVDWSRDIVVGE